MNTHLFTCVYFDGGKMQQLENVPKIKLVRVCLGWSQKRLARELKVSQSLVSGIENNLVEPNSTIEQRLNTIIKSYKIKFELGALCGN